MDDGRFDALARAIATRRNALGMVALAVGGVFGGSVVSGTDATPRRRRRKNRRRNRQQEIPIFTTCYMPNHEHRPIPGGPYPTCPSEATREGFALCDPALAFDDLVDRCQTEYPDLCGGECRIVADHVVGSCPDYTTCYSADKTCHWSKLGPIPGGPFPSCWSWKSPFFRCWTCPKDFPPNYHGMRDLCAGKYAQQLYKGCFDGNANRCYPRVGD